MYSNMRPADISASLSGLISNLDEPFSGALLRFIDAKGKTDAEVYKRANIDRRLFSKIRTGNGYMPSKKTIVALAVALELSLPETLALLERAGYTLSRSVMFDVIIECFISHGWYDIFEINNVLFEYDQPLLGG
jgi:transcriptional regulator with XRE-family HTH domain